MKKFFGWLLLLVALGCFAVALFTIAAVFGADVMLICLASGIGFGLMQMANKMIG